MDDDQMLDLIRASERRRLRIRMLSAALLVPMSGISLALFSRNQYGWPLFILLAGIVITVITMTIAFLQTQAPAGSLDPRILAKRVDELQARVRREYLALPLIQLGLSFAVMHATSNILASGVQGPFDVITLVAWIVATGAQGLALGSNRFARKLRLALDDELFKYHRSQAVRTGFYACLASSLIVFAVGLANPIQAISLLPALLGLAVAIAGLHFFYLDWRAEKDG